MGRRNIRRNNWEITASTAVIWLATLILNILILSSNVTLNNSKGVVWGAIVVFLNALCLIIYTASAIGKYRNRE